MKVMEVYTDKISSFKAELDELKRKDVFLSSLRLITGVTALALVYLSLLYATILLWLGFVLSLIAFVRLVIIHQKLRFKKQHKEYLLSINQCEIGYLKGDFTKLPEGIEFKNGQHLFAEDLDLFGRGSLFQRICRSKNVRAHQHLASQLKTSVPANTASNQFSVKELRDRLDWRQDFAAHAKRVVNNSISPGVKSWIEQPSSPHVFLRSPVLWTLTFFLPIISIILLTVFGIQALEWLIIPFLFNLFLFSRVLKLLKNDHQHIDNLSKDFEVIGTMIAMIEKEDWQSPEMQHIIGHLEVNNTKASAALHELSQILSRLDSMNNAIGALLLNGFCFYHLHVYKSSLKWKSLYAAHLVDWLDSLAQTEALVDKANFAFNHQNYHYAAYNENVDFRATNLGHPFLDSDARVGNDIDFSNFSIMILTGSNMAGKSTFLRSIGLSVVMSGIGLPVCADALTLSDFSLLTSMKPQDSVNDNTSYFQAEVNRLRAIMDQLEAGKKCFLLLDEILRGTNSQDKRNGTKQFLKRLEAFDIKGVIATHDIEIAELTEYNKGFYQNNYFESEQRDERLLFDYKLKLGICQNPNATALMRLKGII